MDEASLKDRVAQHVERYMNSSKFDASHDWSHIQRVLATSLSILEVESRRPGAPNFDIDVVHLAALMHDVTDHKYVDSMQEEDLESKISRSLREMGASQSLADAVQIVCRNVSYSHEIKNPNEVQKILLDHPELGIVQDADRLDAIGAVGIARTFAYTGASSARGSSRSLGGTIDHFHEKLERIQSHMKTAEGRRRAEERTRRLEQFRGWFGEESASSV